MLSFDRPGNRFEEGPVREADRSRGIHAAWSRLGWPKTYGGKLWLGTLVTAGAPVAIASLAWEAWGAEGRLSVWLAGGLGLGAVLSGLLVRALVVPLRQAASSAREVEAGDELDDAALLCQRVPRLAQQSAAGSAALASGSSVDSLTGLPNRQEALERLRQALALAVRDRLPVTAALVDIDRLSAINDHWGTRAGDSVLLGVGHRLEQLLRGSDWAARWEEDQFLLVLFSNVDGAQAALERVRQDLGALRIVTGQYEVRCTVSLGASQARWEDRVQDWLERVEAQLARSKEAAPGGMAVDF